MNIERYVRDYARTIANLASVLRQWRELSGGLREHYADELLLMLARRHEVLESARAEGTEIRVSQELAWADASVFEYRRDVLAVMGFDPVDVVLCSVTTRDGPRDTGGDEMLPVLPLAA